VINAYIALGSNLGDPTQQIKTALNELALLPQSTLVKSSRLYRNPPQGLLNQPDFVNAVAKLETDLSAQALLAHLLAIERAHQRMRMQKNGPRTLDLDLLLFGNEIIVAENLLVPHPRMKERSFVIFPLAEIEPDLILPCCTVLEEIRAALTNSSLEALT
jgi:2-amino-4-hydroxy-6-hydroxymethyldihydropteridine diphosphokinase